MKKLLPVYFILFLLLTAAASRGVQLGGADSTYPEKVPGTFEVSGQTTFNSQSYTWPSLQGETNTFLKNTGSGVLTWEGVSVTPGGDSGAVQFNAGGSLSGEATNFFFDSTNKRLGIGTGAPAATLEVAGDLLLTGSGDSSVGGNLSIGSAGASIEASTGKYYGDGSELANVRPSGAAGGSLSGTYPNPSIAAGAVATAEIASGAVTGPKLANSVSGSFSINTTGAGTFEELVLSGSGNSSFGGDLAIGSAGASIEAATGKYYGDGSELTNVTPSGAAGGSLSGTYPNPTIAAGAVATAEIASGAVTGPKLASSVDGSFSINTSGKVTAEAFYGSGAGLTGVSATPAGGEGAVQFNSSGTLSGEATNLFYDVTNKRLGIGTGTPASELSVKSSSSEIRLHVSGFNPSVKLYDQGSHSWKIQSDYVAGDLKFTAATGTNDDRLIIKQSGNIGVGASIPGSKLEVQTGSADTKGLIVKAYDSQSADLTEWQNSSGTIIASVDASGNFKFGSGASTEASTGKIWATTFYGSGAGLTGISLGTFTQYGVAYADTTSSLSSTVAGSTGKLLKGVTSGAPVWSNLYYPDNYTQYGLVYASTTSSLAATSAGAAGKLLKGVTSGAPVWSNLYYPDSYTRYALVYATTTSSLAATSAGATGKLLKGVTSSAPVWSNLYYPDSYTRYALVYATTTSSLAATAAGTSGAVLKGVTSSAPVWGQLSLETDMTGILPVVRGGTSVGTFTQYGLVYASTTSSLTATSAGAAGKLLKGVTSGAPVWSNLYYPDSYTRYALVYATTTSSLAATAVGTTGAVLKGVTSGAPVWGQVSLSGDVTGVLPIAKGGTNASSFAIIDNDADINDGALIFYKSNSLVLSGEAGSVYFDASNKRLGIGTRSPNNLIQVADLITFNNSNYGTFLGYQAGKSNLAGGTNNTAVGYQSFYSNDTGDYNTAIGQLSLFTNTSGYHNTALGYKALYLNTTGFRNTATGMAALHSNTGGDYNTATGYGALYSNTTGIYNTADGYMSLYYNTTGGYNTATGVSALSANTSGVSNTASGYGALVANTTGAGNSAFGREALASNSEKSHNTAMGYRAMYSNSGGVDNVAVGSEALYSNTSGYYQTAIGRRALYNNTTGIRNTAVGYYALFNNTEGINNVAVGGVALNSNTSGNSNTALGYAALNYNQTGSYNTAVGHQALSQNTASNNNAFGYRALYSNTTGRYNSAFGYRALYLSVTATNNAAFGYEAGRDTTGNSNTFLGYRAGDQVTTGSQNIVIGYNIDAPSNTGNSQMTIGNIIFGTNIAGTGTTISTGNIGIGINNPSYKLDVAGGFRATGADVDLTGLGSGTGTALYLTGSNRVVKLSSSKRYKTDIRDYDRDMSDLGKLSPVRFKWNESTATPGKEDFGLIAEDVEKVFPELVTYNSKGQVEGVDYAKLSVVLLKAVKEQANSIGRQKMTVSVKTSDCRLSATDEAVICDSGSPLTVTLPQATGSGRKLYVKNVNAGAVSVMPFTADTIDGQPVKHLNQWDCITVVDYASSKWAVLY